MQMSKNVNNDVSMNPPIAYETNKVESWKLKVERLALWLFWVTCYCYCAVQINVVVVVIKIWEHSAVLPSNHNTHLKTVYEW